MQGRYVLLVVCRHNKNHNTVLFVCSSTQSFLDLCGKFHRNIHARVSKCIKILVFLMHVFLFLGDSLIYCMRQHKTTPPPMCTADK